MHIETKEELTVRFKPTVLEYATHLGAIKARREFNVPRSTFYRWEQKYENGGRSALYRQKTIAFSHPRKTSPEVVAKILALRTNYQLGALRVKYYLERYHGIKISESDVTVVPVVWGLKP